MYFSGQHGRLQIQGVNDATWPEVGRLKNWSYTTQQQTLDTTALSDIDKTIINGVRSTTGQASLFYYEESNSNVQKMGEHLISAGGTDFNSPSFGSSALQPTMVLIQLSLPGGVTAGIDPRTTAMYAYITSFAMTCSVSEVVSAEISWEAHGAPFRWNY